jgi:hypothetical protein
LGGRTKRSEEGGKLLLWLSFATCPIIGFDALLLGGNHPFQFLDLLLERADGLDCFQHTLSERLIGCSQRLILLSELFQFFILAYALTLAD